MIRLIRGDCLSILPQIKADIIITDPPYGVNLDTYNKSRGRGCKCQASDYPSIVGDNEPFDPSHLLGYNRVVLFGANYYADKLPPSSGWVVWDKLNGLTSKRDWGFNDNADCEMIWTNVNEPCRLVRHRWMGMLKDSERRERRVHPTQKPVELMRLLIEHYSKPGDVICDPYMGSGSTGVAALRSGRSFIGIEISTDYMLIAKRRIDAEKQRTVLFKAIG
jgi:site-specific DNA-methyltransferase (adenine-specific)